jgi:CheY-like chemotaxis protein
VVDDDINIRRLVEAALKQNGFEVTHVDSGEKALAALSISPFDVIILDILLPGIDGLETLKQIRANPCFRQLPVIMLTYNVPIKLDKISDNLSEPDIIKDRKLSGRKVHITWPKGDNLQQNSKLELYWNSLRKKNSLAS